MRTLVIGLALALSAPVFATPEQIRKFNQLEKKREPGTKK